MKSKTNHESRITNHEEEKQEQEIDKKVEKPEKSPEELAAEYLDGWKRCQAEFENYKKRQETEKKELQGYLIESLLFDLFPVLDNFRAATGHVPETEKDSPWVTGIQYIEKQLEDALKAHGVEPIEVKEGDAFDPSIHEAVDSQQSTDNSQQEEKNQKQIVEKVLQNGYKIGERVVRAAKVTVKLLAG